MFVKVFELITTQVENNSEFAHILSCRDTLLHRFSKIQALDDEIIGLVVDKEDDDEIAREEENSTEFTVHFKFKMYEISNFVKRFDNKVSVSSSREQSSSSSNPIRHRRGGGGGISARTVFVGP